MRYTPYDNACRLLGMMMNHWSHLEYDLTWGIIRLYDLNFAKGSIITSNQSLNQKIKTLRTAIEYISRDRMTKEWRDEADKIFEKIDKSTYHRNIAAHSYFSSDEKGGILFTKCFANTSFEEKEIVWSESFVVEQCGIIDDRSAAIAQLVGELLRCAEDPVVPRTPNGALHPATTLYRAG